MKKYCIPPWVVQNDFVLLGPRLQAIRVPHLDLQSVPHEKLKVLLDYDFICDQNFLKAKKFCAVQEPTINEARHYNWVWLDDTQFLEPAINLVSHLKKLNPLLEWKIVSNKRDILQNLNPSFKPYILRLSHQEPIAWHQINSIYSDLLEKTQIIWLGETIDGTHIGPIIHSRSDLENYLLASQAWFLSKKLIEAGFSEYWPLFLYYPMVNSGLKVAEGILNVIEHKNKCFLIAQDKKLELWTQLLDRQINEADFMVSQIWSKGLIRHYQLATSDISDHIFLSYCRSPCEGIEYLEGNAGKGFNIESANYSLIGEAIERFSAWQYNSSCKLKQTMRHDFAFLDQESSDITSKNINIYNIEQFHPYGDKWDHYRKTQHALPLIQVQDLIYPEKESYVPECLIPFPYVPSQEACDATILTTSGLATHSNFTRAVIKASLELFERNNLYPHFLAQSFGYSLDVASLKKQGQWTHLIKILADLKTKQVQAWFIVYHLESRIPLVHCFLQDNVLKLMSRGSGSGYSLFDATTSALMEAIQIRQQLRVKAKSSQKTEEEDCWTNDKVIEKIREYLNHCSLLCPSDHPLFDIQYQELEMLDEIKKAVIEQEKTILVADLPCPIQGWSAVRVLIPGFTIHQHSSHSQGGKHILNPVFKHAIPT